MNPSQQQINSAIRTLIASVGSALAGYVIAKGWITTAQASAILSDQQLMDTMTTIVLALLGSAASVGAGVWGLIAHKQANVVAAVAAMPEVAKVETVPTPAGVALANAIPPAPGSLVEVSATSFPPRAA